MWSYQTAPAEDSAVICIAPLIGSSSFLVNPHRREVSSLSRRVMLQPVSVPLQGGLRFFPTPIPASPWVDLTAFLPSYGKERYGLTTFRTVDTNGLGALCPPVVLGVHDRVVERPCTHYSAFWPKPCSIFGLSFLTTFIKSSHVFTIPSIQPRLRLMLADTPSLRSSGASPQTVGTLSEGFRQRVTLLPYLVGYC